MDPSSAVLPQPAASELATALRFLARHPILDQRGQVHAYELLFRSGPETSFRGEAEAATRTMIDNIVLFGVERLTGGHPAFVNCTAETLTGQQVRLLPPGMCILEVLETVEPTPEVIAACRSLKSAGFRIALDDFVWSAAQQPLLELADYVKVDYLATPCYGRRRLLTRLRDYAVALIAEKVETRDDYHEAYAEGFVLFQGYYFCRPKLLTRHAIPAQTHGHLKLLRLLHEAPLDLTEVSELVKLDPALTYRVLRLVNSPAVAMRQEVRSIKAAVMAVGDEIFRRIATLAIASEMGAGQPAELLRMAFTRARFCETAAPLCGFDATEQYLLGILSLLPAMLQAPLEEILAALPLRDEVCAALHGEPGGAGSLLRWHEAHEQADWERSDQIAGRLGLTPDLLHARAADALLWTETILAAAH